MMLLENKTAVVTGAAAGIGAAIAQRLAEAGANVVLTDVDTAKGAELAAALAGRGLRAHFMRCDAGDLQSIAAMTAEAIAQHGRIDVLVNNAGVTRKIPILDLTPEDWDWIQGINTRGLFFCMQGFARHMAATGGGAIVNIASIAGKGAKATSNASYAASKAAAIVMSRVAANELGRHGIRVNAVCPGATRTALLDELERANPKGFQAMLDETALGRFATPRDIADAVLFLASDLSSSITGQSINVDNGLMWD
ncbi:SDR family NAD(P)-dependent oxidoreductase [Alicycliphilus denitrificans]|uniref:SDR family oxidoreductase n=1 Tax=Alicycliphilus denitrificans TaxID=179636 RepID=A0A3R7GZR0_9BURK|nr:SDR family oxidoreductase [Alicycliphilus denitrificans]RKJ95144.1 SDR family oxidoreductase [Alicycliphilus denitrificans]